MQGFLWCDKKMGKLEKTLLTFGLAGTLTLSGCAIATRYTPGERAWFGASIAANASDVAITKYGLDGGFYEVHPNPIIGDNPSVEKMILIKTVLLTGAYLLGEAKPEYTKGLHQTTTALGVLATAWNLGQLLFNSPKKE